MKIRHIAIFLILLVCLVGAVSAADDVADDTLDVADGDAVAVDNVQEEVNEKVNEDVSTGTDDTAADDTLQAQDNNDELKTGTKTVDVNNFTELQDAINTATNDSDNDEYVINLNSGTYDSQEAITLARGTYTPKITINGNGQSITGTRILTFEMGCQITINNLTINKYIINSNSNIILKNVILNGLFTNKWNLTIINSEISYRITNNANLNIINSTINGAINTDGDLTIDDDTVFGTNFKIGETEGSTIHYGDMDKLLPYFTSFAGEYTFKDINVNLVSKTNYGTLYLINATASSTSNSQFINQGNVFIINSTCSIVIQHKKGNITVINSTLGNKITLADPAILNIDDDCKFNSNLQIDNNKGTLVTTNSNISDYIRYVVGNYTYNNCIFTNSFPKTFAGNVILINCTLSSTKANAVVITTRGNLTIINSTFLSGALGNYGNLTVDNLTMTKGKLGNYGKLIFVNKSIIASIDNQNNAVLVMPIDEDKEVSEVYGPNLKIANKKGIIETNDLSKIFPYITGGFYQEGSVVLGNYGNSIKDYGILTIENSTLTGGANINDGATLILKNTTVSSGISNSGTLYLINVTFNGTLYNTKSSSILIISDDTQFSERFVFMYQGGTVITNNTERFAEYLATYTGNVVLTNKTITAEKWNYGNLTLNNCIINNNIINYQNLTLNNCTVNSDIVNNGRIIIDDNTRFGDNMQITGSGEIVINDISKALPHISTITGNYIISDKTLTKTYTFYGAITLNNCTITSLDNVNYATLILKNCTVDVGADNTFLTNLQTVYVSKDTTINGKINDLTNGVTYESLPQNVPKTYVITQDSIKYFIDSNGLNTIINPGDTLDIRGRILLNNSLRINKPVNIISSTQDGYIDLNTTAGDYFGSSQGNSFVIEYNGAYTNITGVYFHNTQLWMYTTHHVTFDNVSVVVENQRIGSGVGIFSIREGSSYITIKNSYFHTTDNERSSTLVLALADYCTIENNTFEGDGAVGNLIYLTTYNVANVPTGLYNSHNKIINNRIRGPETPTSTCYGICISGFDNLVENNTINYAGSGIMFQWGSGITGTETAGNESLVGSGDNIVCNNNLYGGCGIEAGDLIYNNYMEGTLSVPENSKAYNNTANKLHIAPASEATNNTILGKVTFYTTAKDSIIANNTIKGNIEIPSTVTNITLSGNDITGTIILDGSFNTLSNNRITITEDYAVYSNKLGVNNTLTDNYMVANGKVGADAVSLRDPSNTIQDSTLATTIAVTAPSEATVNKTVQVTIKLMDANGNPITAQVTVITSVGSETVNITNGEAVYQYTPKDIGQDTITVKYAGNTSFYPTSNSANINVVEEKAPVKEPVIKITGKNANVDYGFTYKVLITQDGKSVGAGKQVTLKIAGKTLTVKTDKNGYATFTLAVAPKAYTATVTYNKVSQKYKITVKNVIVAKNAKVKKSAKKPVVKVTLKTSAKKPIAGKKVTIKINGKKVTAKTNKKGVATFNIKKIVKKLKAGKSYKYQVIYGKDTIKKTLKVKK